MVGRIVGGVAVVALLVAGAGPVRAESKGCEKVVAAADEAGGSLSADELAKKLNVDVETVRDCLDAAAKAKAAGGGSAPKH